MSDGRVKVVVRSKKVPMRVIELANRPVMRVGAVAAPAGVPTHPGPHGKRAVVFEYVLDDGHKRAIEEGRRLARTLGLELEVVDSAKKGPFGKAISLLGSRSGGPSIVVSPSSKSNGLTISPELVPGR